MSILHLEYVRSDGERETYHLKPVRRYNLGRGSTCELRILDMKMSRQHCAIEAIDDVWYLFDLGSTNGISHNGALVRQRVELHSGDQIHAGSTAMAILAIGDDLDLLPEPAMVLVGPPQQELMPQMPDEMPTTSEDNPWDGLPQEAQSHTSGPLKAHVQADGPTETLSRPQGVPAQVLPRNPTPLPKPTPFTQPSTSALQSKIDGSDAPVAKATRPPQSNSTAKPGTRPIPNPSTATGIFLNLLGRKVGPLTRSQARELKMKDLKGTLTVADIDQYPAA